MNGTTRMAINKKNAAAIVSRNFNNSILYVFSNTIYLLTNIYVKKILEFIKCIWLDWMELSNIH